MVTCWARQAQMIVDVDETGQHPPDSVRFPCGNRGCVGHDAVNDHQVTGLTVLDHRAVHVQRLVHHASSASGKMYEPAA